MGFHGGVFNKLGLYPAGNTNQRFTAAFDTTFYKQISMGENLGNIHGLLNKNRLPGSDMKSIADRTMDNNITGESDMTR